MSKSDPVPSQTDPRIAEIENGLAPENADCLCGFHQTQNNIRYLLQRLEQVTKERDAYREAYESVRDAALTSLASSEGTERQP